MTNTAHILYNVTSGHRKELLFYFKKFILGIAFWRKVGYLRENEALVTFLFNASAHRYCQNEDVPSNAGLLWDSFFAGSSHLYLQAGV